MTGYAKRALLNRLEPIFEGDFIDDSYGFRPGRGCQDALRKLSIEVQGGSVHVIVEADIKGFLETSSYYTPFMIGC